MPAAWKLLWNPAQYWQENNEERIQTIETLNEDTHIYYPKGELNEPSNQIGSFLTQTTRIFQSTRRPYSHQTQVS